ncbi:DNA repair protein RAD51-like protein [Elysia marginata]|uniref:DNA repair protein RAD51 homolog 3 n=1 Tax=Elysia marginata TaxID=1093978 RepID=A0AAV4G9S4_9GAST|nr:DNA repair protein RAD51-like protein [Elysia marginata]
MQLAVDAHIPECFGGVGGETIYIDTEGSLVVSRLVEIARTAVAHCHNISISQGTNQLSQGNVTLKKILEGIHIYRCHDYHELMAVVQLLPEILNQNKKVKLVIVDSLANPFRHNLEDMNLRRLLQSILAKSFLKLASDSNIAVVLTNQMTTKIMAREGDSHQIPALGDTWAHIPASRVLLSVDCHGNRAAYLYKSLNMKETTGLCSFQITDDGVRDIPHGSNQERQFP